MKNLLLLFSFISISAFSQPFYPMPDSAGVWTNWYGNYWYDFETATVNYIYQDYTYFCTNGEDTLINSENYTKIDSCLNGGYKGGFREDSGKVYFVPITHSQEYLLYDFTANDGDTLFDVYIEDDFGSGEFDLHDLVVDIPNPATVMINGEERKVIHSGGIEWIEGIGATTGLFKGYGENISNYFINLACHSDSDTTLYPLSMEGEPSCYLHLATPELSTTDLNIYPNPVKDELTIDLPQGINDFQLVIYNLLGEIVLNQSSNEIGQFNVDVSTLNSGNYILEIHSDEDSYRQKFVKL